ncbi:MAG: ATPase [Candidatus Krumholzibacteriota bacterium]|nr:ATPase [Candidatus Krumholzibacteriota bacterium]
MLIADCGSTWTKILDTDTERLEIIQTREMVKRDDLFFEIATGHSGKNRCRLYRNELIALAEGSLSLVEEEDFSVVDVGGRDLKFIRFAGRKIQKLDWNLACGSSTGATIELLGNYYQADFDALAPSRKWINVTCGVFGMEKVLEHVSTGTDAGESLAMFIHGLVRNVFDFTGRPDRLFLSGGFCANNCFLQTLAKYCSVVALGRTVPLEGLRGKHHLEEADLTGGAP